MNARVFWNASSRLLLRRRTEAHVKFMSQHGLRERSPAAMSRDVGQTDDLPGKLVPFLLPPLGKRSDAHLFFGSRPVQEDASRA